MLSNTNLICDDAGGGRSRNGKFPRSMSDFKPGERISQQPAMGVPCAYRDRSATRGFYAIPEHIVCFGF